MFFLPLLPPCNRSRIALCETVMYTKHNVNYSLLFVLFELQLFRKELVGNVFRSGEITNIVHVLRAEKRWTQSELANELGITRQTVAAIENGKFLPSLELAYEIAHIFERSIQEVFVFKPFEDEAEDEK